MNVAEKIMTRVEKEENGCWIWPGARVRKGYGVIRDPDIGKNVYTHRAMFEHANGKISDGMQIDHLCRRPECCNPDHLEEVTPGENTRRGNSLALAKDRARAKTHCVNGHEFNATNIYTDSRGARSCRACRKIRHKEWGDKRRGYRAVTASGFALSVVEGGKNG